MKQIKILAIAIPLLGFALISCYKDFNTTIDTNLPKSAIIQQGPWKITLYEDCSKDKTDHFAGYVFSLNSNGTITAENNKTVVNGIWNTGFDDGQNEFFLNFGEIHPFHKINDDWHIIKQTSVKICLEDVSKKSGETELLTFEKIN